MAETNPTTTNEFTDVITESSTIPNISPNSPEFVTVTTETTIITSSSSESSENDSELETPRNLIKQYDELFTTPEEYNKFVEQKLTPFKETLQIQHFNLHYYRHRNDVHNIRAKRNAAQKLLEEADRLQKDHDQNQEKFLRFIATKIQPNIKRRLFNPVKIDEEQAHPRLERRARLLSNPPIQTPLPPVNQPERIIRTRPTRGISNYPRGNYFRQMTNPRHTYTPERVYKCFKCESTEHLMYHCPQYRCRICRRLAPGHRVSECPQNNAIFEYEGSTGYHDVEGDFDGNLDGEN